MKQYKRLPRKLKKKLGPTWRQYLEEQNTTLERDYHINKIFNKDYDNSRSIVQKAVNK